jgi:glycosyltransferase involved in cell wall biosynthesis
MRIALLLPTLETGGVERVFANLAGGLLRQGVEVDFIVGRAGGDMAAALERAIPLYDLQSDRMMHSIRQLAKYLREREPDALIAGMTHSTAAAVLARAAAGRRTRIIATEHNTMSRIVANTSGLKYRLMPLWSRWALNSADAIVAVSAGVADDVSTQTGIPRDRFRVIYNPVITSALRSSAAAPLDHPWFRPGEPPVILTVGRLDKQKDFPMLIRAFHLVRQTRPARLVILGEGPDRNRIEKAVAHLGLSADISLPGSEANPYRFMSRSAVFAFSSQWEGFGVALLEALALGMPVVSTNCPHGPAEILCNGKYGALVPPGDHEAMSRALLNALDNPMRPDCSTHLQQFTIENVALNYLSLINALNDRSLSRLQTLKSE